MRDAFYGIMQSYYLFIGSSKIVILFLVSVLALILIDKNRFCVEKRRLTNPAVFLLSIWSGIAYAAVTLMKSLKRNVAIAFMLLSLAIIALSGKLVISKEAYKASIYYYSNNTISILSVAVIIVFFIIYYLISRQLFDGRLERMLFMMYITTLHLFGFYSESSAVFSLFLSPLTIQSIVFHDLLPTSLWLYLIYEDKIRNIISNDDDEQVDIEEIPEEWDMKKHKILNIRNTAIAFVVLAILVIASVFVLNNKINSLYNATVVLENAANTKMSVYELNGSDGTVALTLMISPDGNVTAIGGSNISSLKECSDFIKNHTDVIDKWYLYDDESSEATCDYCVENGIEVKDVYVISGIEKLNK